MTRQWWAGGSGGAVMRPRGGSFGWSLQHPVLIPLSQWALRPWPRLFLALPPCFILSVNKRPWARSLEADAVASACRGHQDGGRWGLRGPRWGVLRSRGTDGGLRAGPTGGWHVGNLSLITIE